MAIKGNKNHLDLVKELVNLVKEGNLSEIELEHSDKESESVYVRVSRVKSSAISMVANHENKEQPPQAVNEQILDATDQTTSLSVENYPGLLLSPMVGTVYLAPEPEASPFVKIGDKVVPGQTVLIVEAMKTLNQIPATNGGVIKRILVEDGTPVEFGSPLIIIE